MVLQRIGAQSEQQQVTSVRGMLLGCRPVSGRLPSVKSRRSFFMSIFEALPGQDGSRGGRQDKCSLQRGKAYENPH